VSENERTGTRSLLYSKWHRTASLQRFVAPIQAFACSMIDIDDCEYCRSCGEPLALIEVQQSKANPKPAKVTARLARMASIYAYSVSCWPTEDGDDIAWLKVRRIEPPDPTVELLTPAEYALFLWDLRLLLHDCGSRARHPGAAA
jgi:hypothetical protein